MVAQKTKMKNIICTMGWPKLLFSRVTGFMPPTSIMASRPARLGQTISMNTQPYSTTRNTPTRRIPSGVRGSTGSSRPKPNMMHRQTRLWT